MYDDIENEYYMCIYCGYEDNSPVQPTQCHGCGKLHGRWLDMVRRRDWIVSFNNSKIYPYSTLIL